LSKPEFCLAAATQHAAASQPDVDPFFSGDSASTGGGAMTKTRDGAKWQSQVMIQGTRISLGYFDHRSDAIKAEEIAGKIRDGLDRAKQIERFRSREVILEIKDSGVVR
jgi:hypothetical protein